MPTEFPCSKIQTSERPSQKRQERMNATAQWPMTVGQCIILIMHRIHMRLATTASHTHTHTCIHANKNKMFSSAIACLSASSVTAHIVSSHAITLYFSFCFQDYWTFRRCRYICIHLCTQSHNSSWLTRTHWMCSAVICIGIRYWTGNRGGGGGRASVSESMNDAMERKWVSS